MVKLSINGQKIKTQEGQTVLEVAKANGIRIPTLCYDPRLEPFGACRLCLVEIEGAKGYPPACATKVSQGMRIETNTPTLLEMRRAVLELILSDHPNDCMVCEKTGRCELQDLAYEFGIDILNPAFGGGKRAYTLDDPNPLIKRDYPYCILCGRCVRITQEVQGCFVFDFINRGFETAPTTPYDRSLLDSPCVFCGQCTSTCPVAALMDKMSLGKGRVFQLKKTLTVCPYCGCGCLLELYIKDGEIVRVDSPLGKGAGQGNLCIKGRYGYDVVNHPERLKTPLIKKNGRFKEASWNEAYKLIAKKFSGIKKKYGADALAFLSSAKCTNEENYLMQKFARATVGTNNIDHCARLCHAPTVPGLIKAFGSGAMTNTIKDLAESDSILVTGSNTTEAHPIAALSIKKAVRNGAKLIVIDPRKIELVELAEIWLSQKPGTDVAVLNGLANVILAEGLEDQEFIKKRTENFNQAKVAIKKYTPEVVEKISGVPAEDLRKAARIFGKAKKASIVYAMGITQHTTGTDNVLAVANLSLLTGNVGKEGAGVNPLRGHNNVQGSSDMGALFNLLPGYQSLEDSQVRANFKKKWEVTLPSRPGLSVVEMNEAILEGKIKAMYILAENPMLSDPDVNMVKKALKALDFLVVQEIFMSETAELADVILPGVTFAEKDGTFTNTERRVQRVRKAIEPIGEAKADWQIIGELSEKLGYLMNYSSPSEIMAEIAELVPQYGGISYARLGEEGLHWPCPTKDHSGTPILHRGKFTRGKGKFHAVEYKPPAEAPDKKYPLTLTTGRYLYHFHTGTMSRRAKGLSAICSEGFIEINPEDAKELKVKEGQEIEVTSRRGKIRGKAKVTERSPKGTLFVTFHFHETPANVLTNSALDPIAKIPEFKISAVKIRPLG